MTSTELRKEKRFNRRAAKRLAHKSALYGQYDNFNAVTNLDNLYDAARDARKSVNWKPSTQKYDAYLIQNLIAAQQNLIHGRPVHTKFTHFDINERGKLRHIRGTNMAERVVQKCLCDEVVAPILIPSLIYDNGACLPGKGTSFAEHRLQVHLREYYKEYTTNEGYCLNIDLSKYFDNVDHKILYEQIKKYIFDEQVLALVKYFIDTFDEGEYTEPGKSIGLGSQISQIAAIFYLNGVDHAIKEQLGIKYYGRYMDDMYLIYYDKKYLQYCLNYLYDAFRKLGLTMNAKKTKIVRIHREGAFFLKGHYILTDTGKVIVKPSKAGVRRMRRKIVKFGKKVKAGELDPRICVESYKSWRGSFLRRFKHSFPLILRVDAYFREHVGYEPLL